MAEQAQLTLGYVEQLYTFDDRDRTVAANPVGGHTLYKNSSCGSPQYAAPPIAPMMVELEHGAIHVHGPFERSSHSSKGSLEQHDGDGCA